MTLSPDRDCGACPNLLAFREKNRSMYPEFFNAPVPSFGSKSARLLIVGLAPGLKGANCTGRPFTKDYAGYLLYETIAQFGLSEGVFKADINDGLVLTGARIANAVRCVPPANKVTPVEIRTCNRFLKSEIENMPHLKVILALGTVAHGAVLQALGLKAKDCRFSHGALHEIPGYVLADSYHCSRYNTSTKVLTPDMFRNVFTGITRFLR